MKTLGVLVSLLFLTSTSWGFGPEGYDIISMISGGGNAQDIAYMDDLAKNEGSKLILNEAKKKINQGKEVLLVSEDKNLKVAYYTALTKIGSSNNIRATVFKFTQIVPVLSKEVEECFEMLSNTKSRFDCYQGSDDFNTEVVSSPTKDLASAISGSFAKFVLLIPYTKSVINNAISVLKLDLNPMKQLINRFRKDVVVMHANDLHPDLNTPLYWKVDKNSNIPEEVADAKKEYAAAVQLQGDQLFYADRNCRCSTNGVFPDGIKVKTDTMLSGPMMITAAEHEKFFKNGKCEFYAMAVYTDDLYEAMVTMGYKYDLASLKWYK